MSQKYGVRTLNYKTIRIFLSQDSILFFTKGVKRIREVLIFIEKNIYWKSQKELSESDDHKEIFSLEVLNEKYSNILQSCYYKPPKGDNDLLSMSLTQIFEKSTAE